MAKLVRAIRFGLHHPQCGTATEERPFAQWMKKQMIPPRGYKSGKR
jgi:hypothetical protein